MSKEKNLGEFIQTVNKEVISTIISKQTNPLKPDKQFTCLMQDVRVQLDVNVTSERKVADGEASPPVFTSNTVTSPCCRASR